MDYFEGLNRENFSLVQKKTFDKVTTDEDKIYYGYSQVCIQDKDGNKYTGRAYVRKEDAKYFSHITGYQIAEHRAYINYLKDRVYIIKDHIWYIEYLLSKNKTIHIFDNKETRQLNHKLIEFKKAIKIGKQLITEAYRYIDKLAIDSWKVTDKIEQKIGQKDLINIL